MRPIDPKFPHELDGAFTSSLSASPGGDQKGQLSDTNLPKPFPGVPCCDSTRGEEGPKPMIEFGSLLTSEAFDTSSERIEYRVQSVLWQIEVCVRGNAGKGLPSCLGVAESLPIAELIHRALVSKVGRGRRVHCPELTGQVGFGQPLAGRHEHAHVMPVDLNGDDLIDHVLLYAPMGLGPLARDAVGSLNVLHAADGRPLWNLTQKDPTRLNRVLQCNGAGCQGSSEWISMTPFVPPRYLKKTGRNSLVGQVLAELKSRNLPEAQVTWLPELSRVCRGFWLRRRRGAAQPPQNVGFVLRLTFPRPVVGPLTLGYASHYGLGLFQATESECV